MTKSPRKNVQDVGIELGAAWLPSELTSNRAITPGLEVDKKAMIRNRYYQIPHPALNTKQERDTHNQDGTKTKTAQAKCQGDSSFEGQRIFKQRGQKESRAYDKLLQVKWPKEVEPLLYFLKELIQNPNFLPDWKFRIKLSSKQQQYLFSICVRFHFCWFIFCRDLQIWLNSLFCSLSLLEISTHIERQ